MERVLDANSPPGAEVENNIAELSSAELKESGTKSTRVREEL